MRAPPDRPRPAFRVKIKWTFAGVADHDVRMQRAIKWLVVVMLAATGVNGLVWLVGLLATQGLDRAEKILSVVAVPTTIAIGGIGLWLAWPGRRSGPARPGEAQPGGGPDGGANGAPRYWTAFALTVSFALNAVLFYVYLPSRLPELGYEIRVGVSGLHPGWSKSNDGESIESSTGFDMELVDFLKSRFDGNKWTVVKVDPVEREKSIVTGAVDLVVSNYSMEGTAVAYGALGLQRREMVDFSGPYFLDTSGIMRNPAKISAETKVPTEKLCVAKGTTAEDYIKETDASRKKGAQYRQQQECFERLLNPADATVVATVTDR